MALAVANAASLKPEVRLAQALHDYEIILTDDEKTQFRNGGVPKADDAINLTTKIDDESKDGRLRCMGPRFITFLESVQEFSSIVDTFVSSHPEIAALVWGGVRLTLLVANNILSYFDKLSELFMSLGKACPRFGKYGSLYPSSKGLQTALCDYYAGIVRLCHHSVKAYRKSSSISVLSRVFSSFEVEFGPHRRELEQLAQEVQAEINLASAQAQRREYDLQDEERQAASLSRRILVNVSRSVKENNEAAKSRALEASRRKMEKAKCKVLDTLSDYDYLKTYKQLRRECVPGTSAWICDTATFKQWVTGLEKTFWCTGKLGSGKSIISTCVTAHLIERSVAEDVTSFFFCRHDDQHSLRARSIIGAIARQLVRNLPATAFQGLDLRGNDTKDVITFLDVILTGSCRYFIVLDGLDECEETQIRGIAQALQDLLNSSKLRVKIYCSARPLVVKWLPSGLRSELEVILETPENQSRIANDIGDLIRNTLMEQLDGESPGLEIGDPNLIRTVQDTLQDKAHGMFLWVKFQLCDICNQKSDARILAALDDLPQDLPQTFERILRRNVKKDDIELVQQMFRWVAVAKRPLTSGELREAIGTEPLQEDLRPGRLINDMKRAVACSGNLLFVDEEEQTVHFTHSSVKQYLLSDVDHNDIPKNYQINLEKADDEAGAVCVTYLNFRIFDGQMVPGSRMDLKGFPSAVIAQSLPFRDSANKIALRLLQRPPKSSPPIHVFEEEAFLDTKTRSQGIVNDEFPFRRYAKQYWLSHTKGFLRQSEKLRQRWRKLLDEADWRDTLSGTTWTVNDWKQYSPTAINWIVEEDHHPLASLMLDKINNHLSFESDGSGQSSMYAAGEAIPLFVNKAACTGRMVILKIFLKSGHVSQETMGYALSDAASEGHLDIVECLLKENITDPFKVDGLRSAASKGHLAVVERLLQEEVDLKAEVRLNTQESLLETTTQLGSLICKATVGRHLAVIDRLMQEVKERPVSTLDLGSSLEYATKMGDLCLVKRLLQHDTDEPTLARSLIRAAANGHLPIVEYLLRRGVDVNTPSVEKTKKSEIVIHALYAGAKGGNEDIVECLLRHGAEINAFSGRLPDHKGTAFYAAASLPVAKLLLKHDANINSLSTFIHVGPEGEVTMKGERKETAIESARRRGNPELVDLLERASAAAKSNTYEEFLKSL